MIMINEKNLFDALVILFFISKSDRCSIGFEDGVCGYFSSGARVDMFVDFCEDLQFILTGELFEIGEEKKIAVVSDYCIWYDQLISGADIDERRWDKWLDHQLVFLDLYPGEKFIVKIVKRFFNREAQTSLQRLHAQKRKVSGLVKQYRLEKLCEKFI